MKYFTHFIRRIYTRYKYGVSCCKAYSLYYEWAIQLRREIKGFKDIAGKNVDLNPWVKDIDKMIEAFDLILGEDILTDEEHEKKIKEGLHLFADNFTRFWY